MKTKLLKKALLLFTLMTGVLTVFAMVMPTAGAALISPTDNPGAIAEATGGETSLRGIVLTIINFALGFLGLVAVIMVIYAGFLYLTSQGNDEATGNAKKIIQYSVVGIILILASFALVNTLLAATSGATQ